GDRPAAAAGALARAAAARPHADASPGAHGAVAPGARPRRQRREGGRARSPSTPGRRRPRRPTGRVGPGPGRAPCEPPSATAPRGGATLAPGTPSARGGRRLRRTPAVIVAPPLLAHGLGDAGDLPLPLPLLLYAS